MFFVSIIIYNYVLFSSEVQSRDALSRTINDRLSCAVRFHRLAFKIKSPRLASGVQNIFAMADQLFEFKSLGSVHKGLSHKPTNCLTNSLRSGSYSWHDRESNARLTRTTGTSAHFETPQQLGAVLP